MNKVFVILCYSIIIACSSDDVEEGKIYNCKATYYLKNETSEYIFSRKGCSNDRSIPPKSIFIQKEVIKTQSFEKISIDNYTPFSMDYCNLYYDKNFINCEMGLSYIKNYEERKELKPNGDTLIFEFTFRFTEERKRSAKGC